MDIQRILILMGLAVTTYMLILAWNEDYGQGAKKADATEQVTTVFEGVDDAGIPVSEDVPTDDIPTMEAQPEAAAAKPVQRSQVKLITIRTDVLDIDINPRGGDIVRVSLPAYPESLDTPDVPFVLVDPRNNYVAQSGLIGPSGTDKGGKRPRFTASASAFELGDNNELVVTLTHTQESGAIIRKHFGFKRGSYLIEVDVEVDNLTAEPWQGALFAQIKRNGQDPVSSSSNLMGMQPFVGAATRSNDEFYTKLQFDDLEEESYKLTREEGYMAMVQHYFVSAWVPPREGEYTYRARKLPGQDVYLFGFTSPTVTVAPGETGSLDASYYVGPKDQYTLEEIATGLELTVDYGFLWWLAQPLFWLLTHIHGVVGNWGLAIIGLTIFVKALLFPLSAASFRSMAKMRKLQPEMLRLKERFGDDRQKFSEAMMELYKKEGANPLGGCFPILLQMPVFLALYWTLMESVELRQSPFYFWIHDLSTMDPYFILPILMGVSMYITQSLNPEPPDPVQAKVFKFMPVMFTFFFLWFPSGLVLYWLVNNILSIAQQLYVTRQIEKAG